MSELWPLHNGVILPGRFATALDMLPKISPHAPVANLLLGIEVRFNPALPANMAVLTLNGRAVGVIRNLDGTEPDEQPARRAPWYKRLWQWAVRA